MRILFGLNLVSSVVHPVIGPLPHITVDMVCDSVRKVKSGKAVAPSWVVRVYVGREECMKVIVDLINSIIRDGSTMELGGELLSIFIKENVMY